MKRVCKILIFSILIISMLTIPVKATDAEMTKLKLKVVEANEDYDIYILLPKKYIMYAVQHDGLNLLYEGANTLKYNVIPSITVNINNVQDNTYVDNKIEYVQIKLDNLGDNDYLFEIIPEYTDMDMLYRIKSASKDNLMVISNFQVQDNTCEMEYNYAQNEIKSKVNSNVKIQFKLSWWQIVAIITLIIVAIYLHKRRT